MGIYYRKTDWFCHINHRHLQVMWQCMQNMCDDFHQRNSVFGRINNSDLVALNQKMCAHIVQNRESTGNEERWILLSNVHINSTEFVLQCNLLSCFALPDTVRLKCPTFAKHRFIFAFICLKKKNTIYIEQSLCCWACTHVQVFIIWIPWSHIASTHFFCFLHLLNCHRVVGQCILAHSRTDFLVLYRGYLIVVVGNRSCAFLLVV